jgi:hypothetical protein
MLWKVNSSAGNTPETVSTAASISEELEEEEEEQEWIPLEEQEFKARALDFEGMLEEDNSKFLNEEGGVQTSGNSSLKLLLVLALMIAAVWLIVSGDNNHCCLGSNTPSVMTMNNHVVAKTNPSASTSSAVNNSDDSKSFLDFAAASTPPMLQKLPNFMQTISDTTLKEPTKPEHTKKTLNYAPVAAVPAKIDCAALDIWEKLEASPQCMLWFLVGSFQSPSTRRPKVQFFPELDRAYGFLQTRVQETVQTFDHTLHQWAQKLEVKKQSRKQQRQSYRDQQRPQKQSGN